MNSRSVENKSVYRFKEVCCFSPRDAAGGNRRVKVRLMIYRVSVRWQSLCFFSVLQYLLQSKIYICFFFPSSMFPLWWKQCEELRSDERKACVCVCDQDMWCFYKRGISLKAQCVTFTGTYWHEMEQKVHLYLFSFIKSLKINNYCVLTR